MNGQGHVIGYIIYDNGTRHEACHLVGGDRSVDYQLNRQTCETSTQRQFNFELRNYPGYGPKPVRYTIEER